MKILCNQHTFFLNNVPFNLTVPLSYSFWVEYFLGPTEKVSTIQIMKCICICRIDKSQIYANIYFKPVFGEEKQRH